MKKDILILTGVVAVTYAWLWYSMNTIHNPLLSMAVYYPVLCLGGSYLLRKISFGVKHDEIPGKTSAHKPLHLTILYSLVATAVIWAGYLLIRPGLALPQRGGAHTRVFELVGVLNKGINEVLQSRGHPSRACLTRRGGKVSPFFSFSPVSYSLSGFPFPYLSSRLSL